MRTLQDLTGQESGIVIYKESEAVVCNWSNVDGYPRVDPWGLTVLGFGEDIPEAEGEHTDDIPGILEGVEVVYSNGEDMPQAGTAYYLPDDITVIAPDHWN